MAFAWSQDAIPNLLIGLFLCGLIASLWRVRGSRAGRPLMGSTGVIENMSDAVVLLDTEDELIALNRAASRVLNLADAAPAGQSVAELFIGQPALLALLHHSPSGRTEIETRDERGLASTYDVEISPLMERGTRTGRAVVLRDVTEAKRAEEAREREAKRVDLLLAVEAAVAHASNVDEVLEAGLETICECMGWPVGHVYRPAETDRPELRSASIDYARGRDDTYDALIDAVGVSGFAPRSGPPGRAWWTREVEFVPDLAADSSHPRDAVAAELGLSAALAIPVPVGSDIVAVLEFLAPAMPNLDDRTTLILKHLGESLGRSVERRQADLQVRGLEYFDGLTGLPNRELFRERLQAMLDDESARDRNMAVLFVDIDGFQQVNDKLGYGAGDDVLREIARRFHKLTRLSDVVSRGDRPDAGQSTNSGQSTDGEVSLSRLGGDEFLLLLSKLDSPEDSSRVAARLVAGLYEPIVVLGEEVLVGASVGIALYPDDGRDAESLIRAADEAMYTAKSHGGNVYRFYDDTMNHLSTRHLHLEHRLREAADREDWTLFYQPIRNVTTGRVKAVEALLRWDYPDLGLVTPSEFLEVAEDIGLSSAIGDWVLREACLQVARWRDDGLAGIRVSVNVSPRQIREGNLVAGVVAALENAEISGEQLELEIKENSILHDEEHTRRVFDEIRDLGVSIALDRFGTGYSSLTHLRSFPIDRLKIDRSVVNQMESDPSKAAIVGGIIGLAHQLAIGVVAEGVENENELRLLRAQGCEEMQGYLFSKPLPPDQVTRFFERDKTEELLD